MKFQVFLLVILLTGLPLKGQDKIILHTGDTILCTVVEIDNFVRYKFSGEELINSIPSDSFSCIILNSGRIIEGKERIIIRGYEDWRKVQVIDDASSLNSLVKVRSLSCRKTESLLGSDGLLRQQIQDVKTNILKQAASQQCQFVFYTKDEFYPGKKNISFPQAVLEASLYRYPEIQEKTIPDRFLEIASNEDEIKTIDSDAQSFYYDKMHNYLLREIENAEIYEQLEVIKPYLDAFVFFSNLSFPNEQKITQVIKRYAKKEKHFLKP